MMLASDYAQWATKFNQRLPSGTNLEAVQAVLNWGDREVSERITGSAALYNCGVRINELCEEIFGRRAEILKNPEAREMLVDVCQRIRWLSVKEIDEAFARLPSFSPASVSTEAKDLGRPEAPPRKGSGAFVGLGPSMVTVSMPKVVIFCLDWSASMQSRDTRTPLNRFELCVQCIQRILNDQVHDDDMVGIVCFGPSVQTILPPTLKRNAAALIQSKVASLHPQQAGGTCYYDAVLHCLHQLSGQAIGDAMRWLVCLTDGDDLGSRRGNLRGEMVTEMLASSASSSLNMVMITVGALKAENLRIIDNWVERVKNAGGKGVNMQEKNASAIAKAFEVVAEYLGGEVGGATEC